jgi:hypothetical protein
MEPKVLTHKLVQCRMQEEDTAVLHGETAVQKTSQHEDLKWLLRIRKDMSQNMAR